jgi:hypothetical protein
MTWNSPEPACAAVPDAVAADEWLAEMAPETSLEPITVVELTLESTMALDEACEPP